MLLFRGTVSHLLTAVGLRFTGLSAVPAVAADRAVDVVKAGVVGDSVTVNTAKIQEAIDDCAAAGGGTICVKPFRFITP